MDISLMLDVIGKSFLIWFSGYGLAVSIRLVKQAFEAAS